MNKPMAIVIFLLAGLCVLDLVIDLLNLRSWSPLLPDEFKGYYDPDRYALARRYMTDKTAFGMIRHVVVLAAMVAFIVLGGFDFIDTIARGFRLGTIGTGLVFAGIFMLLFFLINLPFDAYATFVIEQKYGFNLTTARTFWLDIVKTLLLSGVIGAVLLAVILLLFENAGAKAWMDCWAAVALFQVLIMYVAPVLIMPLFNCLTPLENGELRTAIEQLASSENFQMRGIYTMDGSKRSTKANAALTGFGRFKRVLLFDTLIKQLDKDEIVGVLAHELGHYKHKHIVKFMALSLAFLAVGFYVFSLLANQPLLFKAFGASRISWYASLVFFAILFMPLDRIVSVFPNWLSRKYEYSADNFAAQSTGKPEALITALKKITSDSMGNLNPHPVKVFFDYSHPPVLQRIRALRNQSARRGCD